MIYVVYGKEEYLVDQKVKELTKNPITYDLEFDNLKIFYYCKLRMDYVLNI